jgi:CheY-like chemotaxis protein
MEGQEQRRILVVDDDPTILNVWRRVLGPKWRHPIGAAAPAASPQAGFSIDTATQGVEGFQKVVKALEEGHPYILALVDMRMPPGWDGVETLLHMLEKDPQLEVAVCSSFSDITQEEVARRVGRTDLQWLRKPFDLEAARELAWKSSERGVLRRKAR